MIRQAIIDHHFTAYQIAVALVGLSAVIFILFHFSVALSVGYGAATIASFLLGQGIVALVQHMVARRRRGNMLD